MWMAMADMRHIVVNIKVFPAIGVIKINTLTTDDVNRVMVEKVIGLA
jgi:hypothetical protein